MQTGMRFTALHIVQEIVYFEHVLFLIFRRRCAEYFGHAQFFHQGRDIRDHACRVFRFVDFVMPILIQKRRQRFPVAVQTALRRRRRQVTDQRRLTAPFGLNAFADNRR